jgi:hypothetical protein
MEKELRTLVRWRALKSNRAPTIDFLFMIIQQIKVNLQDKKVVTREFPKEAKH